jgi:hypothetical protein
LMNCISLLCWWIFFKEKCLRRIHWIIDPETRLCILLSLTKKRYFNSINTALLLFYIGAWNIS